MTAVCPGDRRYVGHRRHRERGIGRAGAQGGAGAVTELPNVRAQLRRTVRDHAAAGPAGDLSIGGPFAGRLRNQVEAVDADQARVAAQAYRDYGRGSGHPARLNLGDTYSYALAQVTGEPLLFRGDDFTHTDIRPACT